MKRTTFGAAAAAILITGGVATAGLAVADPGDPAPPNAACPYPDDANPACTFGHDSGGEDGGPGTDQSGGDHDSDHGR